MMTPLTFALLLLACSKTDPVEDNVVTPPDEMVALAPPANIVSVEVARQAITPPATGLSWTYRAADRTALFGPAAYPAFSIQCQVPREGQKQLIFARFAPVSAGSKGSLSFTGNGQVASVPIASVADPAGPGGHWRAVIAPDDIARDIAEAFAGPENVEVSIGGVAPLYVAPATAPRRVLAECLGS